MTRREETGAKSSFTAAHELQPGGVPVMLEDCSCISVVSAARTPQFVFGVFVHCKPPKHGETVVAKSNHVIVCFFWKISLSLSQCHRRDMSAFSR